MSPSLKYCFALFALAVVGTQAQNFNWDCTNSLGTCQNFCFVAQCRGGDGALTYDADDSNSPGRRRLSGCSKTPCSNGGLSYASFGNSCDEFPFASTKEGGSGARLRCVDKSENSSEGGQLGNFYKTINDGDEFGITIENYGGASYCQSSPSCTNDGGEFFMDPHGNFVDGKRSIAGRGLMLDPGTYQPARRLRKLETDAGSVHLVIAENPENPIQAGHQLWSASRNGTVTVTREIHD